MKRTLQIFLIVYLLFLDSSLLLGKTNITTYSLQLHALAPNAGGQEAYALRRATNSWELELFVNTYLRTGEYPLAGIIYNKRFAICDDSCFWQFYVQAGAGLSTAGPIIEFLWGTNFLWIIRLDIATQVLANPNRLIFWSYPLWIGFSLPLF